jgi:hypothetical protein
LKNATGRAVECDGDKPRMAAQRVGTGRRIMLVDDHIVGCPSKKP